MERIKIALPTTFSFTTNLTIRISDINYGGHVGNDAFLSLIHEARLQYLAHYGYSEMNVEGVGLIMNDAAIEFKKELHHGDMISISVTADNFSKLGFTLYYLIELIKEDSKQVAGKAQTGMLCFDYATKKLATIPSLAVEKLAPKA